MHFIFFPNDKRVLLKEKKNVCVAVLANISNSKQKFTCSLFSLTRYKTNSIGYIDKK